MMSLLNDLHTSYKWTISGVKDLLTANSQLTSEKFLMVENPKIEWRLVLEIPKPQLAGPGAAKCYCCTYQSRTCYNAQADNRLHIKPRSLYVEHCKADEEPVSLNISFSILNANHDKVFTRNRKISGVIIDAPKYGFDTFISETEMSRLLINEALIILCEIKTIDDAGSENLFLLKGFDSFINDKTFSDVVLSVGEEKIHAHKILLAKSPVFHKMFVTDMKESNLNEAKLNDIKIEVFHEILRFMYTGKVEKLDELGLEIFKAAHFYQIDDLKLICEHVLRKGLKIENSIEILKLSDEHDADCLKEHCIAFILKNFKAVMKTAGFKDLSKTHPHLPFELLIEIGSQFLK